jgi:hypothetical protein
MRDVLDHVPPPPMTPVGWSVEAKCEGRMSTELARLNEQGRREGVGDGTGVLRDNRSG